MNSCRSALLEVIGKRRHEASHAGLLLSRYLLIPFNDKEHHPAEKAALLRDAMAACKKSAALYLLAFRRWQADMADAHRFVLSTHGRMVVGLGQENVLESGITLHHIYGTPYIPGSALKGLSSHYCNAVWGQADNRYCKGKEFHNILFGSVKEAGYVEYYDAMITPESLQTSKGDPKGLLIDVITPHHSEYYMNGDEKIVPPSDTDGPIPLQFLSVSGTFEFALECSAGSDVRDGWLRLAETLLREALMHWGVGAKTSSGYGRLGN